MSIESSMVNRQRQELFGVDTSIFTREKAKEDLQGLLRFFAPAAMSLDLSLRDADVRVRFQDLTEDSDIPKSVACAKVHIHEGVYSTQTLRSIDAEIAYLEGGALDKVDFRIGYESESFSFYIRAREGGYSITRIDRFTFKEMRRECMYHENRVNAHSDPEETLQSLLDIAFSSGTEDLSL